MSAVSEASSSSPVGTLLHPQNVSGSSTAPSPSTAEDASKMKLPEFYWMVKPCFVYNDEYKDCKSFKARFHQYFVQGSTDDCTHWKEDYDNCLLWKDKNNVEALKKVIEDEKSRVKQRLRSHYANDVWEHRTSPPSDWNKELPEPIKRTYETTLLKKKADELKSGEVKLDRLPGADPRDLEDNSSCTIV